MTVVNNLPESGGGAQGVISNFLSSLQASLGNNSAMQSLFASFLSQNQIPAPAVTNAQTQNQTASVPQNATPDNVGNSGNSPSQASTNAKSSSGWVQIGKVISRSTAHGTNKTAADNKNTNGKAPASGNANNASQNANNSAPANQGQGGQPASGNAQPGAQSTAGTNGNSGNGGNSTDNSTGNTSGKSSGDTSDNANGPNDGAIIVNADAAVIAVPASDPATADPSADSSNAATPQGTDSISAELIALLMQLERLAAAQTQITQASTATDPTLQQAGQTADPSQNASADPGNKIDLKALLDVIARLSNGDGSDLDPSSGSSSASGNNQAVDASLAVIATPAQNAQSSSGATQAQQTTDKLSNADFFNLLNFAANNNQTSAAPPVPAFNAAAIAGAALDSGNGGTGDANMQGQNDAGSRNAAGAMTDTASLPLPASGAQAASPYDFASQLSALRATQGGTTGLPTPVEQVVLQLSRALSKSDSTQMTIQLKPAELGRVDVKLTIGSDGKVQGTVTADNSSTLGLLLKDVRGLERALQEAGLRADPGSLQFGLRGDGQPGSGFGQPGNNQAGSGGNAAFDAGTPLPIHADAAETYYVTPGGVNMRV